MNTVVVVVAAGVDVVVVAAADDAAAVGTTRSYFLIAYNLIHLIPLNFYLVEYYFDVDAYN